MITIKNVSHRIGGAEILQDISLSIPKGQVTALLGPNGAGKSTLLSLIARLIPLQNGEIRVEDLIVGDCSDRILAQQLSILPQAVEQAPRLTVQELVGFGRFPYHQGRPGAEDDAKVEEALQVFDLLPFRDRSVSELSGGQRQRVQIAMTFAQDTGYMLLDEPLNNLDIAASRALMHLLERLCAEHQKTIVIVIHDINVASRYAHHLVAMKDGKVVAEGAPKNVVDACFVADVFNTDASVHRIDDRPVVLI